jgi:hypothetical protein
MESFSIASIGPETAMNDMQRSSSRSCGRVVRIAPRRAAEIEWRENFPCCKPLKSHEMGKSTGYAARVRRCRSKSRRASSTLPRKSPAGCGAGASRSRPRRPRRSGANTTRLSRSTEAGDQAVRARPPLPAQDRVARGRPCRRRAGAAPGARRAAKRSRPEMAPQRLEKIESAPGNGMGSEASNLQDLVHGRADRARLRLTGRE